MAIADFDGDGRLDMYMTIGPYRVSDVRQPTPFELKATILGHPRTVDKRLAKGLQFRTAGEVHFTIYPRWMPLSKIYLGASSRHPADRSFTLSPNDPNITGTGARGRNRARGRVYRIRPGHPRVDPAQWGGVRSSLMLLFMRLNQ